MPGYDGTGPRGRGPMTGGGNGYCMVEIPREPDRSGTGFTGLSEKPVTLPPRSVCSCVAPSSLLSRQVADILADIRIALVNIERSLDTLTIAGSRTGDTDHLPPSSGTSESSERGAS